MRAGRLSVRVGAASGLARSQNRGDICCAAEVPKYGKLFTEEKSSDEKLEWNEELTFSVGPEETSPSLSVMLYSYQIGSDERELLGMGSMSLDGIEDGESKRNVSLPLVDSLGKHAANIDLCCRFYPSRSPGKSRDELGRETLDPILISRGQAGAPKEMNERSPKKAPRRGPSRERSALGAGATATEIP